MTTFTVEGKQAKGLQGSLRVPGDKSISHRAILLAARAEGRSTLRGLSNGLDVRNTLAAVKACGAGVDETGNVVAIEGGALHEPKSVLDVGNSGTGIRLLAGWAAAMPWLTVLAGDESIAQRPMERVVTPLRQMGAAIDGRGDGRWPPLVIRGGDLHGIDFRPPVASAQVKGAVLLAGLTAKGATTVREDVPTRMHTEELMALFGADITIEPGASTVRPSSLHAVDLDVPGDPSQAAFWVVAGCVVAGSDISVEDVYVGPGRAAFLDVLGRMGARIETAGDGRTATIRAQHGPLVATTVSGAEVPGLIDEIPILAVAAAFAEGTTVFRDAAELRVKESDRIATVVAALIALGAAVEPLADGLVVHGRPGQPLAGGEVDAHGDHRIAMAMAIAGLNSRGPVDIAGWESVATSYPTFQEDLRRCVS
jgi:3-phosphoshikimate 1-carboxyvinyltransferase